MPMYGFEGELPRDIFRYTRPEDAALRVCGMWILEVRKLCASSRDSGVVQQPRGCRTPEFDDYRIMQSSDWKGTAFSW